MADIPTAFLVHRVTVEPLIGSGAYGERFGPAVELPAWVEEKRRLARALDGSETVSEATVRTRVEWAVHFPPGSYVTTHTELSGVPLRRAKLISTSYHTDGGMGAWQHLEVAV